MKQVLLSSMWAMSYGATAVSIQGLRGTGDYGPDERPKDFREKILWENPNGDTPITALMSKMGSESLSDPEFSWWEELMQQSRLRVTTGVNDSVTTLAIAPGSATDSTGGNSVVPGDVLMVEHPLGIIGVSEKLLVQAVNSDTSVTVVRGVSGTAAAAIPAGAMLLHVGSAFGEGTNAPNSSAKNPTKFTNLAQIFKTTYSVTNTDKLTKKRTGDAIQNDKKRKMFKHASSMEFAYLVGNKHEDTDPANGKPRRFCEGIVNMIKTHKRHFGSGGLTWNEDTFIDAVSGVFDTTGEGVGDERIVLAGNGALTELNKLARDSTSSRINFDGVVSTYGMNLQRWILPQGTLYVRTHPLFNKNPTMRYSMLGINPGGLKDRYLRKTRFKDNIQPNDADYVAGEWLTESAPELHFESTHFYLANVGAKLTPP